MLHLLIPLKLRVSKTLVSFFIALDTGSNGSAQYRAS
jgi:hypothetical protein